LRIENFEKTDQAALESLARQVRGLVAGGGRHLQRRASGLRTTIGNQRTLRVFERVQHRAFIARESRVGLCLRRADSRTHPTQIEGGPGNARSHREKLRVALPEVAEGRSLVAPVA